MKNRLVKILVSAAAASVSAYFGAMIIPVVMLIISMIVDYISGVAAAWFLGTLNSKTGKHGAVKKVCYMLLVVAAGIIDWVICSGLDMIGITYEVKYYFGLVVTVWLILNELLSILENCTRIGLPVPGFIKPIAGRLKIMVEDEQDVGMNVK